MKKYLHFLFCGFASSLIWGCYNLLLLVLSVLAYGDDVTSQIKKSFIMITVIAVLLIVPFFFAGRSFDHERVNPLIAAAIFAIPQIVPLVLVYYVFYGTVIGGTITWWTSLLHYATDGKTHYEESFAVNAALTYIPIFVSYLGMITKKKKETTE